MKRNISLLLYIFLLIIVFLSWLYTGNQILWLSLIFLISVLLMDLLLTFSIILFSKINVIINPKMLTRNENISISLSIKSVFDLDYKIYFQKKLREKQFSQKANLVGNHDFGIDYIIFKSFLGIFTFKYKSKKNHQNCLVLPISKILNIENYEIEKDENSTGEIGDFIGARDYIQGDSLKNINFKKSSALGKTIVNQYENPQKERVLNIFVGQCTTENYTEVCEAIFAIYKFNLSYNLPFHLEFFNGKIYDFFGESDLEIKKRLASFEFQQGKLNSNTNFDFIILDQWEELNFENKYVYITKNCKFKQAENAIFLNKTNLNEC